MERPTTAYQLGTRNHVLLTPNLVCRGVVFPCLGRLSDQLRNTVKPTVVMKDVEIRTLPGNERRGASELRLALEEILFAHEYVSLGGDPFRLVEHGRETLRDLSLSFSGLPGIWLRGEGQLPPLDATPRFFVVGMPRLEGSGPLADALRREISGLPYLLVHRDRIAALVVDDEPRS